MHRLVVAVALVALSTPALSTPVLSSPALAQDRPATARAKLSTEFKATDTNKDGVLTRAEVASRFARMRTTASRITPEQQKRLGDLWFTRTDANKDNKVTEAEAQALLGRVFDRYDVNGDGKIEPGERAAALKSAKEGAGR